MTTVFDAAGKGAKACWVLMRRARADRFESASAAAKPSPFQGVVFRKTKKPDMYWSAPRGAKRPVISALEIGYVRRSEVTSHPPATHGGFFLSARHRPQSRKRQFCAGK